MRRTRRRRRPTDRTLTLLFAAITTRGSSRRTYKLAGSVIPHKSSENDGIVEFQSCAGGLSTSKFGSTYDDTFYLTGLNHADTAFLNGDALIVNSQKPVKWFECLL
jgi:hypothetical protein